MSRLSVWLTGIVKPLRSTEGGDNFLWRFGSIYIQKEAKGLEEDWDKREPKGSGVWFQEGEGGAESMFSKAGRSCQTKIEKAEINKLKKINRESLCIWQLKVDL